MSRKKLDSEKFTITHEGIPEGLAERLVIPGHIPQEGHLLLPFMDKEIIPESVDLYLLEDLPEFWNKLTGNLFGFMNYCSGTHICQNPIWVKEEAFAKLREGLEETYGITSDRAIFLPQDIPNYWSAIHELVHDSFQHIDPEKRAKIMESARSEYNSYLRLRSMLKVTHMGISHLDWDLKRYRRLKEKHGEDREAFNDEHYQLGALDEKDQLRAVDEFLGNFYGDDRGEIDRFDDNALPTGFRNTLRGVGYNVDNPPEIKY